MQIVDNIRILWHKDFYDFPRAGLCLFNGEKRYFKLIEELYERNPNYDPARELDIESAEDYEYMRIGARIYGIYELLPEELEIEERIHKNFQEHVGMHTDYDENGVCRMCEVRLQEGWDKFYKDPSNKHDVDCSLERPVVGIWIKQF